MSIYDFVFQRFPNDSGPIYQETIEGRIPVEPFNTFSNFLFILLIFYFWKKIKSNPKQHPFLIFCLPIIFISWIGGTMFHGTRSHEFWLALDWMPILFLCLSVIIYFIWKIYTEWWKRLMLFIVLFVLSALPRFLPLANEYRISFGYFVTALTVIIPFVWYAYKTQWKNAELILYGFLIFGLAVLFRTLDNIVVLLPMGTHWLWHSFGALAVFLLLLYIYKDKETIINH